MPTHAYSASILGKAGEDRVGQALALLPTLETSPLHEVERHSSKQPPAFPVEFGDAATGARAAQGHRVCSGAGAGLHGFLTTTAKSSAQTSRNPSASRCV